MVGELAAEDEIQVCFLVGGLVACFFGPGDVAIVERDDEVGGVVEDTEYGTERLVWYGGIVAACAEFRGDGEMEHAEFVFREEV